MARGSSVLASAVPASHVLRFPSPGFLRAYAVQMRPYLLFVSGAAGLAGLAFVPDLPAVELALLALAFHLSYGFGQALTDVFQTDTDSLSSPYRPLSRGTVTRGDVLGTSLTGLALCGIAFALRAPVTLPLCALAVLGLATYTPFKRRWWSGPFYNAWIVALLCGIATVSGARALDPDLLRSPGYLLTLSTVFFGYANFVLAGYFKDVSADRATGYDTLPVRFGPRISAAISDLFALLAAGSAIGAVLFGPRSGSLLPSALFLSAGIAATLVAQIRLHAVRHERYAFRAVAPIVHAFLLLLYGVAAAHRPDWIPLMGVLYLGFLFAMSLRPMREQI